MSAPQRTGGVASNGLASTPIAAGSNTSFTADFSAISQTKAQFGATAGTVAGTNGLQVQVYRRVGSIPLVDSSPFQTFSIAMVGSSTRMQSVVLQPDLYTFVLTNLDATNGLTNTYMTYDTEID